MATKHHMYRHDRKRTALLPVMAAAGIAYLILGLVIRRRPNAITDLHITRAFQSTDHPMLERFMTAISWFGFRPQSLILPLSIISAFWWLGRRSEALLLVAAWGSSWISFLTKQFVRRPRPDATVVRVVVANTRDSSFPSGHVVHYVVFWGFVTYLLAFRTPWRATRRLARFVMAPIIALVGPSRIYLGHHWFTDVLGSYLLGSAYLAGLIELHQLVGPDEEQIDGPPDSGWVQGASQWLR